MEKNRVHCGHRPGNDVRGGREKNLPAKRIPGSGGRHDRGCCIGDRPRCVFSARGRRRVSGGTIAVGKTVTLGHYDQDNDLSNGAEPIEWIVLRVNGDEALLITKNLPDAVPYNEEEVFITWDQCTLRSWLNGTFYNAVFGEEEQKRIIQTTVRADGDPDYDAIPGAVTEDHVWLLRIAEADQYFGSDDERKAEPTAWAKANAVPVYDSTEPKSWWLRSPGGYQNLAAYVDFTGYPVSFGSNVEWGRGFVRPALWIRLSD